MEELQRALAEERFVPSDLGWHEGLTEWVPLRSIIASHIAAAEALKPVSPTSGLAIASLALGASSTVFCVLTGIPAIVCGHLARSEIRRAGGKLNGDGMAVVGLVLGYLSVAMLIAALVFFLFFAGLIGLSMPRVTQSVQTPTAPQHLSNAAAQVFRACKAFAVDNGGRYPETLEELVPFYLADRQLLSCPLTPQEHVGYFYFGGSDTDAPSEPLLMSKGVDERGHHLVIRKDGSQTLRRPPDAGEGTTTPEGSEISGVAVRSGSAR